MVDKDNRCVYNGLEYVATGKTALNKLSNRRLFEIRPIKTFGFENTLNIWVALEDLYFIEELSDED